MSRQRAVGVATGERADVVATGERADVVATGERAVGSVSGNADTLAIRVDGVEVRGLVGQTIAGVLLASGRREFRETAGRRSPRGVFCGIGVCFDCLVTVNGLEDVRACQRRARDGDVVVTTLPVEEATDG